MARLRDMYKAEVAPALMKKFEYKTVMQIFARMLKHNTTLRLRLWLLLVLAQ